VVTINQEQLRRIYRDFEYLGDEFEKEVIKDITLKTYEETKSLVTPHNKTGNLYDNIKYRLSDREGKVFVDDYNMLVEWGGRRVNYALFVHFGTRPHIIKPNRKKALRWSSNGRFVFSKKVRHSGYRGDPFLYKALQNTIQRIFG